jgi:phage gp36-like protein
MAYASVQDMVDVYGAAEMIRASTPDGAEAVAVVAAPIQAALDDASAIIDTYLRKRYRVPLDVAPPEIARACRTLARYDLSLGGERNPSEQVQKTRDEVMVWLDRIAMGKVVLDLSEVAPGDESYATYSQRDPVFSDTLSGGSCVIGDTFWGGPI